MESANVYIFIFLFSYFFPAGNESCPQPQTSEHLAAIEIMKLKHMIILQNKIDLVKESQAKEQHEQILRFVKGILISFLFSGCPNKKIYITLRVCKMKFIKITR